MKKIILLLLIFVSASFADGFIPDPKMGDRWIIRRQIGEFTEEGGNVTKTQYWKYEVIADVLLDNTEYIVILITSDETKKNIKLTIQKEGFILREIAITEGGDSVNIKVEEIIAPFIGTGDYSHLYDLPAFPLLDANRADKYVIAPESGNKRLRTNFRRHLYSKGDVVTTELIWQETENISIENIRKFSSLTDDYLNKFKNDGFFLLIKGEKRRVRQVWLPDIPWWIYNRATNERNYLVDFIEK
ncbi:MAG: hypothetical protein AB1498_11860 [bacterium]